jgi:phosphoglycerol transferase
MRRGLGWIAVAMALALAVRLAGGYLFAGRHGLGLLGQMYSAQAGVNPGLATRIPQALDNLRGHVMALALVAGMPLAAFAVVRSQADKTATALMAYTVLMLGALVAMTVLFTASVAGIGAESNARLHMRYYSFVLPLFLMFAGAQITRAPQPAARTGKLLAAATLAALIVYANLALLPAFQPNYIDSPELYGLSAERGLFNLLTGAALLTLAAWVLEARRGAQLFVFVFTPLLAVVAGHQVNLVLDGFKHPDPYVKAGIFARHYLRPDELKRLVLVGDEAAMLFKTRFFIDDTSVQLLVLPHGQPIASQALPAAPYWLLVMGDYRLPPNVVGHVKQRDFALLQSPPDPRAVHSVKFAVPEADPDRVKLTGLSGFEQWGRWSDAKTVQVEFAQPLPRDMTLLLDAAAYGPNAQQDFVVRIGPDEQRIRLPAEHHTVRLSFHTDGAARQISIEVPHPVSPSQLGQGPDTRRLGIALYSMAVETNPTTMKDADR